MRHVLQPVLLAVSLTVVLLGATTTCPSWAVPEESAPDPTAAGWQTTPSGFTATFHLSPEPTRFLTEWAQPSAPNGIPALLSTSQIRRGDQAACFILFGGCRADSAGNCTATADITVRAPDGTVYAEGRDLEVWAGSPLPAVDRFQLGKATIAILIEPQDQLGTYSIEARICDRTLEECLELKRSFSAVRRWDQFPGDEIFSGYYLEPRPDYIVQAIQTLDDETLQADLNGGAPLRGFFSEVFAANPDSLLSWQKVIERQDPGVRSLLEGAGLDSEDPRAAILAMPIDLPLNDTLWASFFASGDTFYLDRIIENAKLCTERTEIGPFLIGASAKWSLSSNLRQHPRVRQHVNSRVPNSDDVTRELLLDTIRRDPESHRQELIEVIQEQQRNAAGR